MKTIALTHDPKQEHFQNALLANATLLPKKLNKGSVEDLMVWKKEQRKREEEQSRLFFFVGISLSLALAILAINWQFSTGQATLELTSTANEFTEQLEIPISKQLPPPPPVQSINTVIVEVPDTEIEEEIKLEIDAEMTEQTTVEELNIDFTAQAAEEKIEEVFTIVENYPQPIGGLEAFYKYVSENIEYPDAARRLNISGTVFLQFVVEKDGKIGDVLVIRGIGAGCDEEAVRILKNSPTWKPGNQRGRAVRVQMTLPIRFILRT